MRPILCDSWDDVAQLDLSSYLTTEFHDSTLVDSADPRLLEAKLSQPSSKYDADNPSWRMAMDSKFAEDFWKACEVELDTLYNDVKAWKYVKRKPGMQILPSTWAFKIKRFPDGLIKKFKARFCVRGDRQVHGVNYWEIWSPVVQWFVTAGSALNVNSRKN